jgi:hypothetical protein
VRVYLPGPEEGEMGREEPVGHRILAIFGVAISQIIPSLKGKDLIVWVDHHVN